MERRLQASDAMGIHRQLIFPSFGALGMILQTGGPAVADYIGIELPPGLTDTFDMESLGRATITAHNDWVIRTMKLDPDRLRPVAILPVGSVEAMMAEAQRVIDGGGRALWLPSAAPPAGTSPGNAALDPFWALVAAADVAVVFHIASEFAFTDKAWRDHPAFANENDSLELPGLNAYALTMLSMATENFLAAMTLGGVFERHPRLRVGAIELGSNWVGPLAERMDIYAGLFKGVRSGLSAKPSEYLARNVRVTPFHFEPIAEIIERFPHLADVYVYATDYPHVEGGRDSHRTLHGKLMALGDDRLVENFFVHNGELLLPA
jgi:predicted TIM-barrel fold metal-dependent hydrolase